MSKNSYDPYDTFHKFSLMWEKQINDFIYLWTNNKEFIKMANSGTEVHSRYLEEFKKNQETLASALNFPTKNDVANVAALTIQAEEKIEALEEQIWELQDSIKSQSGDIETVVEVSKEVIKLTKQLKTELLKTKKDVADTKDLRAELQEMKFELMNLKSLMMKDDEAEAILVGE